MSFSSILIAVFPGNCHIKFPSRSVIRTSWRCCIDWWPCGGKKSSANMQNLKHNKVQYFLSKVEGRMICFAVVYLWTPDSEFCRFRRKYHSNCSVLLFPLLKNVNVAALPTLAFSSCQTVKFTLQVDTSLIFADFDYACMEILTKLYIWIHLTLLAFSMEPPRDRSTNREHQVFA